MIERRVTDLALAAWLAASGHPLRTIRRDVGRGVFCFEASPDLERAILDYLNRRALVDALTFHETLRNLKAAGNAA